VQRHGNRAHDAAGHRPEDLRRRGDRHGGLALRQAEERHERPSGVRQRHQRASVQDAARGAQLRRPIQPGDDPVGTRLVQGYAKESGERHLGDKLGVIGWHGAQYVANSGVAAGIHVPEN